MSHRTVELELAGNHQLARDLVAGGVFVPETLHGTEEWVPDLRFERIPNVGHFVQHDAWERVNQWLLDFLATPRA